MRVVVEIEAPNWQQDNVEAFEAWLQSELGTSNMYSGDDAHIVSVKVINTN